MELHISDSRRILDDNDMIRMLLPTQSPQNIMITIQLNTSIEAEMQKSIKMAENLLQELKNSAREDFEQLNSKMELIAADLCSFSINDENGHLNRLETSKPSFETLYAHLRQIGTWEDKEIAPYGRSTLVVSLQTSGIIGYLKTEFN